MQKKRPLLLSVCAEAPSNIEHWGVWGASIVKADIIDMGVFFAHTGLNVLQCFVKRLQFGMDPIESKTADETANETADLDPQLCAVREVMLCLRVSAQYGSLSFY